MQARGPNSNLIIGAVLACLGLAALAASFAIATDPGGGWGARIFPLVASTALFLLGLAELVGARSKPAPGAREGGTPMLQILLLLAVSLFYFWLIGRTGYLVSTGVCAVLALMIFGIRNLVGLVAAAVLCPAAYHLIFFVLLGVYPPYGEWFDLLDIIQGY